MELTNAVKTIRKELLIKDEPLKAYQLLKELNLAELKPELDRTYGLVRHAFEEEIYQKMYGMHGEDPISDCEDIEPRDLIRDARRKYLRYQWVLEEMDQIKPKTYLDLACYIGSLVTSAAVKGVKSFGVDMTKAAIDKAIERANSENITNVEFFNEDVTKFDKRKADVVSAFEVLEHVPDPVKFIKHLSKLANKWAYITTPNKSFGDGDGNLGHWDWDGQELHIRGHLRVFTLSTLRELVESCGCEIGFISEMQDGLLWCRFRKAGK